VDATLVTGEDGVLVVPTMKFLIRDARRVDQPRRLRGTTAMLGALAIGLALIALLTLPASAGAVLSGTNGRIVFIEGPAFGNTQLFLRTVTSSTGAGSITGPLATGLAAQHRHPSWSPDRTKVAFAEGPGGAVGYDIYILDLTIPGATPEDVTNSPGVTDDRPAWSPDGTRIAYESGNDIIVHPLKGSDINLTATLTPKAWKAAWSPDSQTLYYSVGDITQPPNGNNNDIRLYRQPADNSSPGTELLHVGGAHVFQPSISPDGTKLCYTLSTGAGNSTSAAVVVAPLSSPSSITVIADSGKGDYNCTWSPDGTKIAYTEDYGANGEIFMRNSDASGFPIDLTNTPGMFDGNPDWAPDGRPTCPDDAVTTTVNTPVTFTVACSDTGPAYEHSNVRDFKKTDPSHGTVAQEFAGDPFVYTPNPGFLGTDSFEVGSFDDFGFGTDTGTVTIKVNAAPTCNPVSASTAINHAVTVQLSCSGGSGALTLASVAAPQHGTLGIFNQGAQTVQYTPNNRYTGGDSFTYKATAGGRSSNIATVTMTVRGSGTTPKCDGKTASIVGTAGDDNLVGTQGNDVIAALAGNDRIRGGGGSDVICAGSGRDHVSGGPGADTISGGPGNDTLSGGSGRDALKGNAGRDRLNGGSGTDRCNGGSGRDQASGCERISRIP
jgi:Ca2+-binding RTX toxin-like protein